MTKIIIEKFVYTETDLDGNTIDDPYWGKVKSFTKEITPTGVKGISQAKLMEAKTINAVSLVALKAVGQTEFQKLIPDAKTKYRIIEYRNDEPDLTRTACKILWEG